MHQERLSDFPFYVVHDQQNIVHDQQNMVHNQQNIEK